MSDLALQVPNYLEQETIANLPPEVTVDEMRGVLMSVFSEGVFNLFGEPLSFDEHAYMLDPLNDCSREQLMCTGRQAGKSTILALKQICIASIVANTGLLHVSPAATNLQQFIEDRVNPFMESPTWRRLYFTEGDKNNMHLKKIGSSKIHYRAVHKNAERCRGITAGVITVDETQGVSTEKHAIISACMTRPKFKMKVDAGTQSTVDSSINVKWERSDQKELAIKCSGCSRWNTLGEKNIGKFFLICSHCGHRINCGKGKDPFLWVPMNKAGKISGYRTPSIGVPDIDWAMMMEWYETWPQRQFYNEVLALPFDVGAKPITEPELRNACREEGHEWAKMFTRTEGSYGHPLVKGRRTFMGIDWGANLGSTTQFCVGMEYAPNKIQVIYYKKCLGYEADPRVQRQIAANLIREFDIKYLCADWGGQYENNKRLQAGFGMGRVHEVMLNSGQREVMHWNKESQFWTASKEQSLSDTFLAIKQKGIMFPMWDEWSPFAKEILNEIMVYNEIRRILEYDHPDDRPDDSLHALNFMFLAYGLCVGKYKAVKPK